MATQHTISEANYSGNIPMMDAEFDRFEINTDFEMVLREAETANFYHDTLNEEE